MKENVSITCWGSRGSCPAPYGNRMEYGGNTTCYVIETGDTILIFDGGTGLVFFGEELLRRTESAKDIHIFLSHLHLDHIVGIPVFRPLYQNGYHIHFYGERRQGHSLEMQLKQIFAPPYWPIKLGQGAAHTAYVDVNPGQNITLVSGIKLELLRANHPDQTLLYRISVGDKTVVYALDCELDEDMMRRLEVFASNADLLIVDANYSPSEYEQYKGWGHSTWREGAALARRCQARYVWFSHFSWDADDAVIGCLDQQVRCVCPNGSYVREGMTLEL